MISSISNNNDDSEQFQLTSDHLTLLSNANIRWHDIEYGAPGIDYKRPYGNSTGIEADMAEFLDLETVTVEGEERVTDDQRDKLRELHEELEQALEIVLQHGHKPGIYEKEKHGRDWEQVTAANEGEDQ